MTQLLEAPLDSVTNVQNDVWGDDEPRVVDLSISGMTCASCVGRIERKLGKLDGVTASVNLPLESARVWVTSEATDKDIINAVEAAGYEATVVNLITHKPSVEEPWRRLETTGPDSASSAQNDNESEGTGGHRGYEGDIDLHGRDLHRRLIVAAVLAVPIVAISMIMPLHFPGWAWVVGAMSLPVATWCAWPFHKAAFRAAKHGSSTMDTLVSLGVIAAMVWSIVEVARGGAAHDPHGAATWWAMPNIYFEVAAVVVAFLLAGRYAEHKSRRRAGDALRALLDLGAKDADLVATDDAGNPIRLANGAWQTTRIAIEHLQKGDVFAVAPGQIVATDGIIVEGASAIDASMVTGEPVPEDVVAGDKVVGGTINTTGYLLVRATAVGAETALARIGSLVAAAQTGSAPIARLGDKISAVFVPIVIGLSILTFVGWMIFTGNLHHAFMAAVAVLIIACPCALGLATPTAILVGTGRGAQMGVLIKGPEILERTRQIDTIILDKTGTVTEGQMTVTDVVVSDSYQNCHSAEGVLATHSQNPAPAGAVLQLIAAVEAQSEHPIAKAIVRAALDSATPADASGQNDGEGESNAHRHSAATPERWGAQNLENKNSENELVVTEFRAVPGGGVQGAVTGPMVGENIPVFVGRITWLTELGAIVPSDIASAIHDAEAAGATTIAAAWPLTSVEEQQNAVSKPRELSVNAVVILRDPPKSTSAAAIAEFKALGLRPVLLTGDGEGAAQAAASAVGIAPQDVMARVLPEGKAAAVRSQQAAGHMVAMVGDGINDAAALATADLGMAMGTGTDAAIEASDITLVRGDLRAAASAVRLSRQTLRIIKQNLFWAFAYNVAAIPLAAAGLLNPMIAGGAMALSSVLVVSNSLRLKRAR